MSCGYHLMRDLGVSKDDLLVLEASEHLGGRVRQDHGTIVPDMTLELGGEWLHGVTVLNEFAESHGHETQRVFPWAQGDGGPLEEPVEGGYSLYYLGRERRLIRYDDTSIPWFQRVNSVLHNLVDLEELEGAELDELAHTSLKTYLEEELELPPSAISLADAGYANTICSSIRNLSLSVMAEWEGVWEEEETEGQAGDSKMKASFAPLLQHLAQHLPVLRGFPVTAIDASDPLCVQVRSSDGRELRARQVIVSASVRCLQEDVIDFTPPLPLHKQLILHREVGMRSAMKVLLKFSTPILPACIHGMICADSPIPEIWFTHTKPYIDYQLRYAFDEEGRRVPNPAFNEQDLDRLPITPFIASGFVTADYADRLAALGEEGAIRAMVEQLDQIVPLSALFTDSFPPPILPSSFFQGGCVMDWRQEPFVRGGYSHPTRKAIRGFGKELREEFEGGRVCFCGEGVWKAGSTIHAAYESGKDAAYRMFERSIRSRL